MIIAIDGPAGAGKTTVAREVARRLGIAFLDTGAMYRAVTWAALQRGIDPTAGEACGRLARELALDFDDAGRVLVGGRPGEPAIRSAEVTRSVSAVSAHPAVREAVVARQRELARERPLVVEGRDTTTVVFPEADHKFFLTASQAERARRRAAELGAPERQDEIRRELARRDESDSTRDHSPLRRARDAELIETDRRSVEAVVGEILARVRGR